MSGVGSAPGRLSDVPGFSRFWSAWTVSAFGTYVTTLALQVLVVLTLHAGAVGVGLVNASRWLPYLAFGLIAGVLIDRSPRRPVLVATDLLRGLLLIGIPVLALTDRLSLGVLMGFVALFGLMSLLNDAASQSFLPRLVPSRLLTAANARLDQSDAVAQTSGPALAGALVSVMSAPWAVLVDAVSYLVSGLLLLRIPVPEPPRRPVTMRGIGREAAEGLRWIYRHPMLRPMALNGHGWFFLSALVSAVVPSLALQTLGLSPLGFGVALSLAGVGGLIGSLSSTRLGLRFGAGRVVIACQLVNTVAWVAIAVSASSWFGWVMFASGQFLFGLALGGSNANEMGYRQVVTPDHLQGRTNATMRSINRAAVVLGAPLGGLLGDVIGFAAVIWIAAGGLLILTAALALSRFRDARIDDVVG